MKLYYDFHIHSGLSPCGSDDMTPNNIVNMSLLKELNIIAVTDHNACGNVEAVQRVAEGTGLIVIPGMEVETSEEVHVVCLFGNLQQAKACEEMVTANLPAFPLRKDIFGQQLLFDHEDEVVGTQENLLITATSIDFESLIGLVKSFGGIAIPAHVFRSSNSILSNLGFIPPIGLKVLECNSLEQIPDHMKNDYFFIVSSDAHYLENISERENFLESNELSESSSAADVVEYLRRMS